MRLPCALLILTTLPAGAGELADTCVIRDQLDLATCGCIEEALQAELSPDDLATYMRIGEGYFDAVNAGLPREEAWDNAVKTEATAQGIGFITLLTRTNEIGRFHADSIRFCRS